MGGVVNHGQVLGADHLGAAAGAAALRAAIVHPGVRDAEFGAAHMQDERQAPLRQGGPDGFVQGMAGGASARRVRRYPQGAEAQGGGVLDLRQGPFRVVQSGHGDANEASIRAAELRHRSIVGAGGGVAQIDAGRAEDGPGAEGGEDHLPLEAEQVQRLSALLAAEGAQRVVPLGAAGEVVPQGGELRPALRRMAALPGVGG